FLSEHLPNNYNKSKAELLHGKFALHGWAMGKLASPEVMDDPSSSSRLYQLPEQEEEEYESNWLKDQIIIQFFKEITTT
ncbi:hypothetical protein ACJX0J_029634, partial [Zea mays]